MSKKTEEKQTSPTEEILTRIQQRVASSFTHVKKDKIKKIINMTHIDLKKRKKKSSKREGKEIGKE